MAEEKVTLKINRAVDYLQKINSKQDEQQTRSLSQKMVESLNAINSESSQTNKILTKSTNQQKNNQISTLKTILNKFLPKRDLNRTDDNDEKNFRQKLLAGITDLGAKLKKDKGLFGLLFGLLGSLLSKLFNGFRRLALSALSMLFRHAVLPLLKAVGKPIVELGKKGINFLKKSATRIKRRVIVKAGRIAKTLRTVGSRGVSSIGKIGRKGLSLVDDGINVAAKSGTKLARVAGGFIKSAAKIAGPVGIAITVLDAGFTAIDKMSKAGDILGKAEEAVTAGDRLKVATAGVVESLSFGLISAEKYIQVQDKASSLMWSGFEKVLGKGLTDFGRNVLNFFDVIVTDFTTWLTGGNFWSDWAVGWDYLKNNFGDAVSDMFSGFWDGIKFGLTSGVITWVYDTLGGMNNPMLKWMNGFVTEITDGWKNVYNLYVANNPIFKFFTDLGNDISNAITSMYDSLVQKLKNSSVGKYLTGAWAKAKDLTANDKQRQTSTANQPKIDTRNLIQPSVKAQSNVIDAASSFTTEKQRKAAIASEVEASFKLDKTSPVLNSMKGADKQLAILLTFLYDKYAPYQAKCIAEMGKEGGDIRNVALVNPLK